MIAGEVGKTRGLFGPLLPYRVFGHRRDPSLKKAGNGVWGGAARFMMLGNGAKVSDEEAFLLFLRRMRQEL